jgi:hypothetical protein
MLIGWGIWKGIQPGEFVPIEGVSIFAALYIMAQVIERVLEPFSSYIGAAEGNVNGESGDPGGGGGGKRFYSKGEVYAELRNGQRGDPAYWLALLARIRRNRAIIMWAISSFLAMLISGGLGIFLLKTIGLKDAPPIVDVLFTGLIVGSGTKPLHDLISNIQKSSSEKDETAAARVHSLRRLRRAAAASASRSTNTTSKQP